MKSGPYYCIIVWVLFIAVFPRGGKDGLGTLKGEPKKGTSF